MVSELTEDVAVRRAGEGDDARVRRYADLRYAARSCREHRRVIARIEASAQGVDRCFIVTNLPGRATTLYARVYCARGQAENLIKAHKFHLASDRTSCHSATANQSRLIFHSAAYWLLHILRAATPRRSYWRTAQFDTPRPTWASTFLSRPFTKDSVSAVATNPHAREAAITSGKDIVKCEPRHTIHDGRSLPSHMRQAMKTEP